MQKIKTWRSNPKEILLKRLETEEVEEDKKNLIIEAFDELLSELLRTISEKILKIKN